MLLYLDDDSVDGAVIRRLADGGHDVLSPSEAGTARHADPVHLMCAIRTGRILLTHDHEDFTLLHDLVLLAGGHHPGILVIRRDNDPTRDCPLVQLSVPSTISRLQALQSWMQFTSSTIGAEGDAF
jgi:predicted nuclease of predicted toxin-antitoxin system